MTSDGPNRNCNEIGQLSSPAAQLPLSESTTQVVVIRKGDRSLVWKARGKGFCGQSKNGRPPCRTHFSLACAFTPKPHAPCLVAATGPDERLDFRTSLESSAKVMLQAQSNCYYINSYKYLFHETQKVKKLENMRIRAKLSIY